jgi:hypothetical protein
MLKIGFMADNLFIMLYFTTPLSLLVQDHIGLIVSSPLTLKGFSPYQLNGQTNWHTSNLKKLFRACAGVNQIF